MSSESFADLGVSRPVLGALAERVISEPFAVQRLCITDVLAGEDVLVQSPTGEGCEASFDRIAFRPTGLDDLRDGS